jgi:hypothetical protein
VYAPFDSLATARDDYAWPTDASTTLTSAFCDFRSTHLHAGIDISTNGRTGYRVTASRRGWVSAVSVNPFGYGKLIELTHDDGFITVYAHLKGFNEEIETSVKRRQREQMSYAVELNPEPGQFAVEKGELIAYTGDTGIGAPHLHFEILDPQRNPVNPLLMPALRRTVRDREPPSFLELVVIPLDHATRVNGDYQPSTVQVRATSPRTYLASGVIHAHGTFGIGLRASDRHGNSWHRFGTYALRAFLDDSLLYRSTSDQLTAGSGREVALHFDWPLFLSGGGRVQRLFIERGNRLPLYHRLDEGSGVITTGKWGRGHHTLRITAEDIHGNRSELQAILAFDDPPAIDVRREGPQLVVVPAPSAEISTIAVARRTASSKKWITRTYTAEQIADAEGSFRLPITFEPSSLVRISASSAHGSPSHPHFVVPVTSSSSNTSLKIEKQFFRDYVYIRLTSHLPFTLRPSLWLQEGADRTPLVLHALDERTYAATFPLSSLRQQELNLEAEALVNGTEVRSVDRTPLVPITAELGGTVESDDGRLMLVFPPDGVYETLYCRITQEETGYSVAPNDRLLKKPVRVYFRMNAEIPADRLGLFSTSGGELSLMSRSLDPSTGAFSGRFHRMLGDVAVLPDTVPPSITRLSGSYSRGVLRVTSTIDDERSGIDSKGIRLWIDGRPLIPEYHPYDRRIRFEEPMPLEQGLRELRLEIRDRMGNTAAAQRALRIGAD